MLEVQKYLESGKSIDDLTAEFGIKPSFHPSYPLVILNYDQILSSPKSHPIIRECRALVLNTNDWSIVAKSFNRFFNWGEVADEMGDFDFSDFIVDSKEDGSLCVLFHFDGKWHANTRGSFATDNMQDQTFTWQEGFCRALGIGDLQELAGELDEGVTYIAEFCSPWNKIVRRYEKPVMYLLAAFDGEKELHWSEVDLLTEGYFKRPQRFEFNSIDEIQNYLAQQSANDPTFEGVVIRDHKGNRWKIKSATYLGLHKLRGEGDNLFNPKHLLPFVLAGEEDELLTYYPEVTEAYYKLKCEVQQHYIGLLEAWGDHKDIQEQKDFALAIKDRTPFASVLFTVRKKQGSQQKAADVRKEFRDNDQGILKRLKT